MIFIVSTFQKFSDVNSTIISFLINLLLFFFFNEVLLFKIQESAVTSYFSVFFKKDCSEESFWANVSLFIVKLNVCLSKVWIKCFQNNTFVECKTVVMFFIAFKVWILMDHCKWLSQIMKKTFICVNYYTASEKSSEYKIFLVKNL